MPASRSDLARIHSRGASETCSGEAASGTSVAGDCWSLWSLSHGEGYGWCEWGIGAGSIRLCWVFHRARNQPQQGFVLQHRSWKIIICATAWTWLACGHSSGHDCRSGSFCPSSTSYCVFFFFFRSCFCHCIKCIPCQLSGAFLWVSWCTHIQSKLALLLCTLHNNNYRSCSICSTSTSHGIIFRSFCHCHLLQELLLLLHWM